MPWTTGLKDGEGQITRRRRKKKATAQPQPLVQAPQPLSQNQAQTQPPVQPLSQNQAQPQVHPPEPLIRIEAPGNPQLKKRGRPTKAVEQEAQPQTKRGRGRPSGSKTNLRQPLRSIVIEISMPKMFSMHFIYV
jgi:hypothetical protein